MPKTGGTWTGRWLRQIYQGTYFTGHYHDSVDDVDPGDRTVFGTIRDPWSWYYSWWWQATHSGISKKRVFEYGGEEQLEDFRSVLYGATHPEESKVVVRPGLFWGPQGRDESFANGGRGLYSWSFHRVYGDPAKVLNFVDMSDIQGGITSLVGKLPYDASGRPRENVGSYEVSIPDIYDEEMEQWVRDADRKVINMLGYSSPGSGLEPSLRRLSL